MTLRPCVECGEPSEGTRCPEHTERRSGAKTSAASRGYDAAWRRLSQRARERQPFCSDCGATADLQADHTPEAWARHEAGKAVRLCDVDVVCGRCNRRRGAARGPAIATERVRGIPGVGGVTTRKGGAKFRLHSADSGQLSEEIRVNRP